MVDNWKAKIHTKQDALVKIVEIKKYLDMVDEPNGEYDCFTMLYAAIYIAEIGLEKP